MDAPHGTIPFFFLINQASAEVIGFTKPIKGWYFEHQASGLAHTVFGTACSEWDGLKCFIYMYKDESGMFTTVSCKFFSANDWKLGFEMI
jgi:hypothetical protein